MNTRDTAVQDRFGQQFFCGVGTVEGGDGTPVQLNCLTSSWNCIEERNAEYGCQPGERALCVDWIPVGMTYTNPRVGILGKLLGIAPGFPKEAGVDPAQIPPRDTWVVFPRSFGGLPVYYRRGQMAFAL